MSIHEESDGLLGTQIYWEDIQKDCFKLFGPRAKLGENKTIKDIADGRVQLCCCREKSKLRDPFPGSVL